ncbi:MAG: hypothetical protein HQL32_14145, partial [Planctomycetes bacterium]|nr:hypothetical protein [Planctomycetota bacterium]
MKELSSLRSLAYGSGVIAFSSMAVKALGVFRDMIIAKTFGVSAEMDAYIFSFTLVSTIAVISSNAMYTVYIPRYIENSQQT